MIPLSIRLARSELSRGVKGFWIYLACIALGTAAISAAGSVTQTFAVGVAQQARALLGADAEFSTSQRRPSAEERHLAAQFGTLSEGVSLDVMGATRSVRAQIDLRGVDGRYPLIGKVGLSGGQTDLQTALSPEAGRWGVVVTQSFLDTFELSVGDPVDIGPVSAVITARLDSLPDRLGAPGTFGPEALIALEALEQADRLTPGQLFRARLRILFDSGTSFDDAAKQFEDRFPDPGPRLRSPEESLDGLQTLLQTLNSFLALIGIAALAAGGIGVAQAISAFLDSRTKSIAVLKVFGADAATIRAAYLLQLGLLAFLGAMGGTAIGAAAPYLLAFLAGGTIPLPQALDVYPLELIKALMLGLLATAVFALPKIGKARATPPSTLLRPFADANGRAAPWLERVWTMVAAGSLIGLAVITSYRPTLTAVVLAGAAITIAFFVAAGMLVKTLARVSSRNTQGFMRLALANLGGPGSLASSILPSLGLGLALLVLVVSVQTNLIHQISSTAPANAPSLVFSQIPNEKIGGFNALLSDKGIDTSNPDVYRQAPFLLGRVTSLNGKPLVESDVSEAERWVVRGETGLTYLDGMPPETDIAAGEWWPAGYTGALLTSVESGAAQGLGIGIGDTIGFRIGGREVEATVSSLRKADWGTFGIGSNTAFILSPGTLEAARPAFVAIARATPDQETAVISALGKDYSEVVVFQTRPALETASRIFGQIALAVNAAAAIVTLAGSLVLIGTFATIARTRRQEAALLKVFGGSRGQILCLYAIEFGLAAGLAALLATIIGVAAAYPVVTTMFEAKWSFPWAAAASVLSTAVAASAAGGAVSGWMALSRTPADVLRASG